MSEDNRITNSFREENEHIIHRLDRNRNEPSGWGYPQSVSTYGEINVDELSNEEVKSIIHKLDRANRNEPSGWGYPQSASTYGEINVDELSNEEVRSIIHSASRTIRNSFEKNGNLSNLDNINISELPNERIRNSMNRSSNRVEHDK